MCVCSGLYVLLCSTLLMVVNSAIVTASGYIRAHGAKELWPYFRCELICPYGYQPDVEGNYVCVCHNPCQNVRCFGNTQCVVDLPKLCTREYCRARATCKDVSHSSQSVTSQHGVLQADDAATTSSGTSLPDRCSLPVTGEAKKCRKMRMRWYFDNISGTCKPFRGCRAKGNNFRGSRGCEKTCVQKSNKRNRTRYPVIQGDDAGVTSQEKPKPQVPARCLMSAVPITSGCKRVSTRWFFDQNSGTCQKFRSCSSPSNNFSKKMDCKRRCLGTKRSRRKPSVSHSPNQ